MINWFYSFYNLLFINVHELANSLPCLDSAMQHSNKVRK
jgi:hypothetical protein